MLLRKKIIKKISLIYALLPKVKSIWGGGGQRHYIIHVLLEKNK